jgi:hypothetical protein
MVRQDAGRTTAYHANGDGGAGWLAGDCSHAWMAWRPRSPAKLDWDQNGRSQVVKLTGMVNIAVFAAFQICIGAFSFQIGDSSRFAGLAVADARQKWQ